jgi:Glu-tRNA(Gln) amidotransferase subunit E-like FAD-binding protein
MTKEQTAELIKKLISEQNITDLKTQRWLLMKELMANYKWQIDGWLVNEIINEMVN